MLRGPFDRELPLEDTPTVECARDAARICENPLAPSGPRRELVCHDVFDQHPRPEKFGVEKSSALEAVSNASGSSPVFGALR